MPTVKIATDVGTHEGEGAKISTQSSLVTSRNTTSPLSLGTPSYGDTLATLWALCCHQVGFPCDPLQHRFLKGHVRSSCIFKYAPVKPWEVFRSTIQRMYVSSKIASRKTKLMGWILNFKFSHTFFSKFFGVSYYLPKSNHKINKQVANEPWRKTQLAVWQIYVLGNMISYCL